MALNGGPQFTFTPATSFFVELCHGEGNRRALAGALQGGTVLMELAAYPFSRKFGWTSDRFGVSWQLNLADQGRESTRSSCSSESSRERRRRR